MKKLSAEVRRALRKAGVEHEEIEAAAKLLEPKPSKLKPRMVKRIAAMVFERGVAIVTPARVYSEETWEVRKKAGHTMIATKRANKEKQNG